MKKVKIKLEDRNDVREVLKDCMPAAVAAEMLAAPIKMSARMRKNCIDARTRYFTSTLVPKPADSKIFNRLAAAKMPQLGKWLRRVVARRAEVHRAYLRCTGVTVSSEALRTALDNKAKALDRTRRIIEQELLDRMEVVHATVAEHIDRNGRLHAWQRRPLAETLLSVVKQTS
jgi:hypothetical protein